MSGLCLLENFQCTIWWRSICWRCCCCCCYCRWRCLLCFASINVLNHDTNMHSEQLFGGKLSFFHNSIFVVVAIRWLLPNNFTSAIMVNVGKWKRDYFAWKCNKQDNNPHGNKLNRFIFVLFLSLLYSLVLDFNCVSARTCARAGLANTLFSNQNQYESTHTNKRNENTFDLDNYANIIDITAIIIGPLPLSS